MAEQASSATMAPLMPPSAAALPSASHPIPAEPVAPAVMAAPAAGDDTIFFWLKRYHYEKKFLDETVIATRKYPVSGDVDHTLCESYIEYVCQHRLRRPQQLRMARPVVRLAETSRISCSLPDSQFPAGPHTC